VPLAECRTNGGENGIRVCSGSRGVQDGNEAVTTDLSEGANQ
jgi:hypothetical protein